jgi:hypothetical protein
MKLGLLVKPLMLIAVTAGAIVLVAGCGSTKGYKGADKTGVSIAEYRDEVLKGKQAIDATMVALDEVAASATTDPRNAFEKYGKAVANLESTAAKIRKRGQDMRAQGDAYFAQWQKELAEVKNPDIQKLAAERQAKLKESFDSIRNVAEPLKTQFDPWMSDLKDLQKYLSNDLTISGVDAAKGLFKSTREKGADVQKSMDALVAELNTVAATITAAKVQPQAGTASGTNAPPAEKK